ncbi:hypothetical protein CDLVIII_2862 [Clostridium sp. DL-VIII]|uniref:hypothetical protein n=1 Tax=Clostridium sp. DL-VIII TaxID=641107 RepID=UPI00023AFBA2|nr:hypothetical protein [Clostridium sp. DL-VIII]EHI99460.1 hypothetical protein CDLVIII_2862 [Clostridium sp. DL-VIII]
MLNKKLNILLSSILGVALNFGILEIPVFANSGGMQAVSSYTASDNSLGNQKYIVSKDNDIEQNGLKISIDSITATKHKLQAVIKVQGQKAFGESHGNNVISLLTYGDNKEKSSGTSYEDIDENTLQITLNKEVDDEEIPEKGNLRVDIVIPEYKINVGMDANVDFTESFNDTMEKDVSIKVPESDFTVSKLESNILGTEITYDKQEKGDSIEDYDIFSDQLILKAGDRMYRTMNEQTYSSNNGDNTVVKGVYESEAATFDKVKDQKAISIIPISCNMSEDEREKINEENYKNFDEKKAEASKEITNNISYDKNFDFSDGTKGEIYKVERNDNSVKIYCKGATEKESLLMASTMGLYPTIEDIKAKHYSFYKDEENMSFYKDANDSLGYIVEFDNFDKDEKMELGFESIIKEIDRFQIGNEVNLSK